MCSQLINMLDLSGVSVMWIIVQWLGSLGVVPNSDVGECTSKVYFCLNVDQYASRRSVPSFSNGDASRCRTSMARGDLFVVITGRCKSSLFVSENLCGIVSNISRCNMIANDASMHPSYISNQKWNKNLLNRRAAKSGASALYQETAVVL